MKRNTIILIVLSVLTLAGLFYKANPEAVGDELTDVNLYLVVLAIIVYIITTFFKMLRWHLLLKSIGSHFPLRKTALFFLMGLSINSVTPGGVSGEPVRVYFIKKEGDVPVGDGIATIFAERFMDITVLVSFALLSLLFIFPVLDQHDLIQLLAPIGLVCALLIFIGYTVTHEEFLDRIMGLVLRIAHRIKYIPGFEEKLNGMMGNFRRGIQEITGSRKEGLMFFAISYLIWGLSTLRIWILLLAMDIEVSLYAVLLTSSITYIFGVILPGGTGNIAAIAAVFSAVGVDIEAATAVGVLEVATSLFLSVPAGLIAMTVTGIQIERGERKEKKMKEQAEIEEGENAQGATDTGISENTEPGGGGLENAEISAGSGSKEEVSVGPETES